MHKDYIKIYQIKINQISIEKDLKFNFLMSHFIWEIQQ